MSSGCFLGRRSLPKKHPSTILRIESKVKGGLQATALFGYVLVCATLLLHLPAPPENAIAFVYQEQKESGVFALRPDGSGLVSLVYFRALPDQLVDLGRDVGVFLWRPLP